MRVPTKNKSDDEEKKPAYKNNGVKFKIFYNRKTKKKINSNFLRMDVVVQL